MNRTQKQDNVHEGKIEVWMLCLAGALLLFAIAAITLTIQTPNWPVVLFGGKQAPPASVTAQPVVNTLMTYSINTLPVFADGNAEGNLEINCDVGNQNSMTVRVVRKDNGEIVYAGQPLKPGDSVRTAKLSTPLAAGEYACTAEIDVLNEDGSVSNTLKVDMNVTVQA